MKPTAYYVDVYKVWNAVMIDFDGTQVGPAFEGDTMEHAMFYLGVAYGRRPQDFARPLSEISPEAA